MRDFLLSQVTLPPSLDGMAGLREVVLEKEREEKSGGKESWEKAGFRFLLRLGVGLAPQRSHL